MDPRLVEIHNSCVSPFHILIETPRDKKSHVFSNVFSLLYWQKQEPWRQASHLVFDNCSHMLDSLAGGKNLMYFMPRAIVVASPTNPSLVRTTNLGALDCGTNIEAPPYDWKY